MYRPRTSDSYQSVRATLTKGYRQLEIEGVSDSAAVGFVREFGEGPGPLPAGYMVFQGKQSKASHHYSAKDIAEAEQRVSEALRAAQWVVNRRAEDRQKVKTATADYTEHTDRHVLVRSYSLTATAKFIREALKAAFPGVKFSVTSESASMTSSVDIRYTDGPSCQQVRDVYAPFVTGHFDSQQDMHVFNTMPTAVAESGELIRLSYGAKYIDEHRSYSAAYGHCFNSLDLREVPRVADQLCVFLSWHTAREYNLRTSYTENEQAGTLSISSSSRSGDMEKLAAMLTAQGHAPELSYADDVQTLTVAAPTSYPAPVQEAPTVQPEAPADELSDSQQVSDEYEAAEQHWLAQDTDTEYEAAERQWLSDLGEYPAPVLPWLRFQ